MSPKGKLYFGLSPKGTLDGVDGTLIGKVHVDKGGLVNPGDLGIMTIKGDYTADLGSTLTLDVAGPTNYDALNITGNGTFDGTVNLDFINGYTPSLGDSFDFITDTGGTFTWNPSSINFIGVTPGTYTTDLTGGFGLIATSNWALVSPPPPASSTPEPAGLVLFGTGLVAMACAVRRKARVERG